jgi:hypothetical protein
MSLPNKPGHVDDQELARYLLGLLPDEEAERLDEASIADDEIAQRLRAVEHDLVDAYIRGTLSGELLERFESRYLNTPRRRDRVRQAASFLRALDRAGRSGSGDPGEPTPTAAGAGGHADGRAKVLSTRRWMPLGTFRLGILATAAVLLVACGVLLLQTARLRSSLDVARAENAALNQHAQALEQQLSQQRANQVTVSSELQHARESATAPPPRVVQEAPLTALLLLPQTRAVNSIPTLAIPARAERVRFDLRLESNEFPGYQVHLTDPATNQIVWRSDTIAAPSSSQTPTLSVAVPSRVLRPQHYSFALMGRRTDSAEVVGSYTFLVVPN